MIKNVLFDLDGTLLRVDMDDFKSEFFQALGESRIVKKLGENGMENSLSAYRAMHYGDGSKANEEIFTSTLEEKSGFKREYFLPELDEFFSVDFDRVETAVREKNRFLIESVKLLSEKGYNLILATAPVFPRKAILKRLGWSGVDGKYFSYITTCENSRYYKYDARYYIEIAEKCGLNPEECIMVGNSVKEDLVAAKAGMECFYIRDFGIGNFKDDMCQSGSAEDFYNFVKRMAKIN